MTETKLKPILDRKSYSEAVQDAIELYLYEHIYQPLLALLHEEVRWHSFASLEQAFISGKLQYNDGWITGTFNAATSMALRKIGASFSKDRKAYYLPFLSLPVTVRSAIAQGKQRASVKLQEVKKKLTSLTDTRLPPLSFDETFGKTVADLHIQTTKTLPKDLEIPMAMTQGVESKLREDYNLNLNLSIKDWTDQAVYRLREAVDTNVAEGFRSDKLSKTIQAEYGVSRNKAKFLARQETSLLVSKYREQRYKEAGLGEYVWSTSHDDRVRNRHKELDKKRFSWDSPPIVDTATGRRANPGEDFNCRCVAIPILKEF